MRNWSVSAARLLAGALLFGFGVTVAALVVPSPVAAGTGRPWARTWAQDHPAPKPCSGDDCKADDPRSGSTCQGLMCSFSSPKAMEPPMTAAHVEELARQRAETEATQAAAISVTEAPAPAKARKRLAKAKSTPVPKALAAAPAVETAAPK